MPSYVVAYSMYLLPFMYQCFEYTYFTLQLRLLLKKEIHALRSGACVGATSIVGYTQVPSWKLPF